MIPVTELSEVSEKAVGRKVTVVVVGQGENIASQTNLYLEGLVGITKKLPDNAITAPMIL